MNNQAPIIDVEARVLTVSAADAAMPPAPCGEHGPDGPCDHCPTRMARVLMHDSQVQLRDFVRQRLLPAFDLLLMERAAFGKDDEINEPALMTKEHTTLTAGLLRQLRAETWRALLMAHPDSAHPDSAHPDSAGA